MGPDEGQNELEGILSQSETQPETQNEPTYRDGQGQNELLSRTSPTPQQERQQQLLAGKFKSPQDLEKGYRSAQSALGKANTRAQQLERLIQTPGVYERLASTAEGRETLAALGFEMRTADQENERTQEAGYDEYDEQLASDLRGVLGREPSERDFIKFETIQLKETNRLNWELFYFGQNRGKPLSPQEERGVRDILRVAPRLTIAQAYRLTPEFEQGLKTREDQAVQAATRKAGVKRPAPNPTLLPGAEKLDLKKPVHQMNDAEKRAYVADLYEKNQ